MPKRDPNTLDLTHQQLRIADDVMVWPIREQGELVYRLEIPSLHRFFRIGYEEYVFISLLDGRRTLPQACGLAAAKLGSRAPTAAQAGTIARWLLRNELATLGSEPAPSRKHFGPSVAQENSWSRWLAKFNPFWIKVPLPKIEHSINQIATFLSPLLHRRLVALGVVLILVAVAMLVSHAAEFVTASTRLVHPSNWLWLLVTWVALKVVHELGHAVACERQGATVRESGLVFILFAPMAYVDVTSCWRLNSRYSRIAIAAAGMYVELVIAALAAVGWVLVDDAQLRYLLHNVVFTAGLSTLLFNANALMRFDGYFILADLIEIPNLYNEASASVRRWMSRILTGQKSSGSQVSGWRRHFVLAYGLAAFVWKITICVSLGIAASTMFAGAGIALTAIGIATWLGRPLMQLFRFGVRLRNRDPARFLRATVVGSMMALITAAMFFWVPIPTSIRVAAISRHLPETTVRSGVSGFVSAVHVADGSEVRAGQLLLELQNPELSNRLRQLELTFQQNEIRLRKATDALDTPQRQVLRENQKAIVQQMEQLRSQTDGLRVIAPRDGRVIARNLAAKLGTYVSEGDHLLIIATPTEKELFVMIPQGDIQQVRDLVGTDVKVQTTNYLSLIGRLERIEPRADAKLEEISLAASEGGVLAVEPIDDPEASGALRLTEPHFRGRVQLASEVGRAIPAGMRMTACIGHRRESAAARIQQTISDLWHEAHQQ